MKAKCYAKINLALDILGRDSTGFHEIQTVFYEYKEIYDEIYVHESEGEGISIEYKGKYEVESNHKNSCYQAAKLMQKLANKKEGLHIELRKNIPIGAGLAGGSSNAAGVLKILNELWELNWSKAKLAEIGSKIGMDVPFFVYGGTALGTHYGEKIQTLPRLPDLDIVVEWPEKVSPTKEAYQIVDIDECGKNADKTKELIKGIKHQDKDLIIQNIHNDFDFLLHRKSKILRMHQLQFAKGSLKIMEKFKKQGAKAVCLTGSGSGVIGVF